MSRIVFEGIFLKGIYPPTNLPRMLTIKQSTVLLFNVALGIGLLTGCAGQKQQPTRSGFLSRYHHLESVDGTTSRYVDAARLKSYNKFKIASVQVPLKTYNGKAVTLEQQKKIADYLRSSLTTALQSKYSVVETPSTDTAEIRIAVTEAYKSGNQLGITVEGEIQDSYSGVQVAAVVRTDLGAVYLGDWWDKTSAKEIVDGWSQRLVQAIDSAHGR